jgi:nucleotide-binding universal stress UspA family protein
MRVLIGTDGSADAAAAAKQALTLLAHADAFIVVCVIETPGIVSAGSESGFAGGIASPEDIDIAWAEANREATEAIEHTVAALEGAVAVEPKIQIGSAGDALCRLADELTADVVVVGSRGRGAIRRALMGSVSTHVVNNCPKPVLVVRSGTASA